MYIQDFVSAKILVREFGVGTKFINDQNKFKLRRLCRCTFQKIYQLHV